MIAGRSEELAGSIGDLQTGLETVLAGRAAEPGGLGFGGESLASFDLEAVDVRIHAVEHPVHSAVAGQDFRSVPGAIEVGPGFVGW